MKTYFKLRKPANRKSGKCQVQLYYLHGGNNPLRLNTNIHVSPTNWNDIAQEIIIDSDEENEKLTLIKKDILRLADEFWDKNKRGSNYPTPEIMRGLYEKKDEPLLPSSTLLVQSFETWY